MLDNAGYECKVTYEIEEEDVFKQAVEHAWARDYVLTANLTSSVKGYEKTEFGSIKLSIELRKQKIQFPDIVRPRQLLQPLMLS